LNVSDVRSLAMSSSLSPSRASSSFSSKRTISIRPATIADSDAIANICLLTANQGYSAEKLLRHPDLPAHIGPLPYLYVPSGFGFVLTRRSAARKGGKKTKTRVVGYAVGTAHSARFEREAEANWWPIMRMRYPEELAGTPLDRHFVGILYKRLRESKIAQEELPVRIHVTVLEKFQRWGCDRLLVDVALRHLRTQGFLGCLKSDGSGTESDTSQETISA